MVCRTSVRQAMFINLVWFDAFFIPLLMKMFFISAGKVFKLKYFDALIVL